MAIRNASHIGFDWAGFVQGVKALARAWERRRVVGRLGALDDRLLADIGITRYDVMSVLAEPLFVDPSEKLAERAEDMRRARRSAAAMDVMMFGRDDAGRRRAA